jgi:cation transport regulator ChaB
MATFAPTPAPVDMGQMMPPELSDDQVMDNALAGRDPNARPPGTFAPVETGIPQDEAELPAAQDFGPNNEKLPKKYQDLLKDLLIQALDAESKEARREEVRRIRQAREFWKGLQYNYYNAEDERWHLPWESTKANTDDQSPDDLPRYMFVTNYFQAFGLSIIAVLSQDIPKVRPWPQDPDTPADRTTAKAATTIIELVERNNSMNLLMTDEAFYLWCDGKIGGYVRYVTDGSRFGYHDEPELGEQFVHLGEDSYGCGGCGQDTPASQFMGMCSSCGNEVPDDRFQQAPMVKVPIVQRTIKTPNGAEVITIVGGLELKTPPWARYQWEFPYMGWDIEVHRARLMAAFPKMAKEIKRAPAAATKDPARPKSAPRAWLSRPVTWANPARIS